MPLGVFIVAAGVCFECCLIDVGIVFMIDFRTKVWYNNSER